VLETEARGLVAFAACCSTLAGPFSGADARRAAARCCSRLLAAASRPQNEFCMIM